MKKDLYILVADRDIAETMKGIVDRDIRGIRQNLQYDIRQENNHDAGVYKRAPDWLRPLAGEYECAMVIFDYHGCGAEHHHPPEKIQEEVREEIAQNGWNKAKVFVAVFDPELEGVVWNQSGKFAKCIGFASAVEMSDKLKKDKVAINQWGKPKENPKERMEQYMRDNAITPSASVFGKIASNMQLQSCRHPIYRQMVSFLKAHFPGG